MRNIVSLLFVLLVNSLLTGCVRNDDEPLIPRAPISRLYVSLYEFQTDETADPFQNLVVLDPSNSEEATASFFNSGAQEGSGVFFSPEASRLFQGSVLNQSVVLMSVTDVGIPQRSGQISNADLTAIRGIHYDHDSRNLFVANNWTPSGLYVFDNPLNRNGEVEPLRYFPLGEARPWGITMWEDQLLVVRTGSQGGVNYYSSINNQIGGESDLIPASELIVSGASSLRGVSYSVALDMMVLTEYDQPRILIFDNASQLFQESQGSITPTRIIAGPETGLTGPTDVAIDDRDGGESIYVADKRSKSILRFSANSSGNARPLSTTVFSLSPEAIFLDARGLLNSNASN